MTKIAFLSPVINIRGTCVAMYDYADYSEKLLGNKSIIVVPSNHTDKSDIIAINKFVSRFPLLTYDSINDLDNILENEKCDILYCIKYGTRDDIFSRKIKTVIHCVFDLSQPHGDVYTAVSLTLAKKFNTTSFVPHMISLPPSETKENLRKDLSIPEDAIVFGRHGGQDTFNIGFCWEAINFIVKTRRDIYFLFINTPQIVKHPQIKYLPSIVTNDDKNRFICTCDAHLECNTLGHTFGLSMGEFSINNKPIIAYKGSLWNTAHLDILGDKAFYFKDKAEFYDILTCFNRKKVQESNWNCYSDYTPQKVMEIFKKVFIDN
jgi:hypothetical protein